jgi:hypothetical protein
MIGLQCWKVHTTNGGSESCGRSVDGRGERGSYGGISWDVHTADHTVRLAWSCG